MAPSRAATSTNAAPATREAPTHQRDLLLPQAFLGVRSWKAYIMLDSITPTVTTLTCASAFVISRVPPLERHRLLRCARSRSASLLPPLLSYYPLLLCCSCSAILKYLLQCCPQLRYRYSHSHWTQSLTICSQGHHALNHLDRTIHHMLMRRRSGSTR